MFYTLLITTLFLLTSLLASLLSLSLSIIMKHLCLSFHSLPISMDFFRSPPSVHFDHPIYDSQQKSPILPRLLGI